MQAIACITGEKHEARCEARRNQTWNREKGVEPNVKPVKPGKRRGAKRKAN